MREICMSGSRSGRWKRGTVGYSGTGNRKGQLTRMADLHHRATSRLYSMRSVIQFLSFVWPGGGSI